MGDRVSIATFYWDGTDRPGWHDVARGFDYVSRLFNGVSRNLKQPFDFYCFTDVGDIAFHQALHEDIRVRPLNPLSYMGCLPKLEIHNPEVRRNDMQGRVVVFDLDTVITGDLSDIVADHPEPFITRAWFKGMRRGVWLSGGDLLSFKPGLTDYLYKKYAADVAAAEHWTGGRERFIYRKWAKFLDYWQRVLPGQVVSFKNHIGRSGKIPDGARVVSVHGNPRPHEINQEWIKECWK